jgi:hypothetical protein
MISDSEREIAAMQPTPKKWDGHAWKKEANRIASVLRVFWNIADSDGNILEVSTWVCGPTPKKALRLWQQDHLAETVAHFITLTTGPKNRTFESLLPQGPKVRIKDIALQHVADGLQRWKHTN